MIIQDKQQQVLMERRDIDYILPQYIRSYMYYTRGADPVEIVFPMFSSVPHPTKPGVRVPIHWVPEVSVEARMIAEDGSNVPEATEAQVAEKDRLEEENKRLKEQLAALTSAQNIGRVALDSDRAPRQPEHPATGSPDMMQPRDKGDLKAAREDLKVQPDIDESKQKPYSKKVSRKASGEPVVEE